MMQLARAVLTFVAFAGLWAATPVSASSRVTGSAPSVESSLIVGAYLGPGVAQGHSVWFLTTRYERVVTRVTSEGADQARGADLARGEDQRLQDQYSLVRLDLRSGARRTLIADGVVDLRLRGGAVLALARQPGGWRLLKLAGDQPRPVGPLVQAQEAPLGLYLDQGRPVVLTRTAIYRWRPFLSRWRRVDLDQPLTHGSALSAAPLAGQVAFIALDGRFRRVDLRTGRTASVETPAGACGLASGRSVCDQIRTLIADPARPACVLAASGVGADHYSHGAVVRLCGVRSEAVWSQPTDGASGPSAVVLALAPAGGASFYVATHLHGLYRVTGARAELVTPDHRRPLGGLEVACAPKAIIVSGSRDSSAPMVLADPKGLCSRS